MLTGSNLLLASQHSAFHFREAVLPPCHPALPSLRRQMPRQFAAATAFVKEEHKAEFLVGSQASVPLARHQKSHLFRQKQLMWQGPGLLFSLCLCAAVRSLSEECMCLHGLLPAAGRTKWKALMGIKKERLCMQWSVPQLCQHERCQLLPGLPEDELGTAGEGATQQQGNFQHSAVAMTPVYNSKCKESHKP